VRVVYAHYLETVPPRPFVGLLKRYGVEVIPVVGPFGVEVPAFSIMRDHAVSPYKHPADLMGEARLCVLYNPAVNRLENPYHQIPPLRYLYPPSGKTVTRTPSFSFFAYSIVAKATAPPE